MGCKICEPALLRKGIVPKSALLRAVPQLCRGRHYFGFGLCKQRNGTTAATGINQPALLRDPLLYVKHLCQGSDTGRALFSVHLILTLTFSGVTSLQVTRDGCTTARYSTAPFAYWYCGARIVLFVYFHRDAFCSLPRAKFQEMSYD